VADPVDLTQQIIDAASGPASVTADGLSVTAQDPTKIAQAQEMLNAQAASKKRTLGLRFVRLIPPGATGLT
jgi:hypothetical protein